MWRTECWPTKATFPSPRARDPSTLAGLGASVYRTDNP